MLSISSSNIVSLCRTLSKMNCLGEREKKPDMSISAGDFVLLFVQHMSRK